MDARAGSSIGIALLCVVGVGVKVLLRYEAGSHRRDRQHEREVKAEQQRAATFEFDDNDPKILAAKTEAKRRLPEFGKLYAQHEPGAAYMVQAMFYTSSNQEDHEWLKVDSFDSLNVSGTFMEEPTVAIGHHLNERVTIPQADVVDWLVKRSDGTREGNFIGSAVEQLFAEHMAAGHK